MNAQEFGDPRLRSLGPGHRHDELEQVILWHVDFDAIQFEKDESGNCSNPLVAVDKWVIVHDVEHVGRGHLNQIGMVILARRPGAWHGKGGTQERRIADSRAAPIPLDLVPVDLRDLIETEKARLHRLPGEPLEGFPVTTIDLIQGFSEFLAALRSPDG